MKTIVQPAKKLIAAFMVVPLTAAAPLCFFSAPSYAQFVVEEVTGPVALMTELMNWIENMMSELEAVVQTAEQIAMVEEQIKQVEMMITNLVKPAMQMWARVNSLIDRFNNLSLRLRRLTDKDYYLSQLKVLDFYKNNGCFAVGKQCTQKDLEAWRDYVLAQSKSYEEAMKALVEVSEGQKESLMDAESRRLKELMQDAANASGAMEAMGSTNSLLGNLNQQMMSLRAAQLASIDLAIEKARAEHQERTMEATKSLSLHGKPSDLRLTTPPKEWAPFD